MSNEQTSEAAQGMNRLRIDVEAFLGKQKTRYTEIETKQGELQARLLELEQKAARRGRGDPIGPGGYDGFAVRALLDDSADLRAVADRKARRAVIDLPAGFFKAAVTSGDGLAMPNAQPGLVAPVQRRLTIRALIPSIPTTSGSVQYTREVSFDNQAATVSETAAKPESTIVFELKSSPIAVIAHFIKCSNQVLADTPQLMQYLDTRLRYGLAFAEELQLLKGSGVGSNLQGLLTVATAFDRAASGNTKIDALRCAITQLQDSDYEPTGIILNPTDWQDIALTKSTTGEFIVGQPSGPNPPTLWNLPVIPTGAMTSGQFLVADFPQSTLLFDREQARLDIATENEDDFVKNMALLRVEERLGLAVLRTGGLIKGTF